METRVIKEGKLLKQFANLHYNGDSSELNQEETIEFLTWYCNNVTIGAHLIILAGEEGFGVDDVTGEVGEVYPYEIIRFIRD